MSLVGCSPLTLLSPLLFGSQAGCCWMTVACILCDVRRGVMMKEEAEISTPSLICFPHTLACSSPLSPGSRAQSSMHCDIAYMGLQSWSLARQPPLRWACIPQGLALAWRRTSGLGQGTCSPCPFLHGPRATRPCFQQQLEQGAAESNVCCARSDNSPCATPTLAQIPCTDLCTQAITPPHSCAHSYFL